MSATLVEIAKQAGVSRSTVSRVINDHPNVDQATRARVRLVAESMNYLPNVAARGLAVGRTRILGLAIPTGVSILFSDPYFPILIQGITSLCNAMDHSVMLWLAEPEYERRMIRQILQGGMIDGVIVASALMNDPLLEALTKRGLPFVLIGHHIVDETVSYVDVDNKNSAQEMVNYLLHLGHRRIATIRGPKDMGAGVDRYAGYAAALTERRIALDPNLIVESDFTEEGGYRAMQQILPYAPDAIFAASDGMAVGAMRAIRDAGLSIPEDIAVAGFDDIPLATRVTPQLTTVRQPIHRLGATAAETLIDLIRNPDAPARRIVLPTELIIRGSTNSALRPSS